ncbi:hypothetical protein KM043_007548 [Ampulex compressa]|nr:hypothetical protein KM043_007548 [Ampulex compressa]
MMKGGIFGGRFIHELYRQNGSKQCKYFSLLNHQHCLKPQRCTPMLVSCTHNLATKNTVIQKESLLPVNKFVSRTHTCGELMLKNVGEVVQLYGWVQYQRRGKFVILRDAYGSTQIIVPDDREDLITLIKNLTFESVIYIRGVVAARPEHQRKKEMITGDIEVQIQVIEVLNKAKPMLPVLIREHNKAKEEIQMRYRYLSLRFPDVQKNLRLRSQIIAKMREYLVKECDFVDIETPTLFKHTPEGAQEFIVPTRNPGHFYSLVQSPQQFKQLLMIGGFDRYFQVARCYRDEAVRHDRQPEFTQLDIELSFVDQDGVMALIENLLVYSWPKEYGSLSTPFKRMKFEDAMNSYGTDQPDLRIPYQIQNLSNIVDVAAIKQRLSIPSDKNFEVHALLFPGKQVHLTRSTKEKLSKTHHLYFPTVKLMQLKVSKNSGDTNVDNMSALVLTENVRQELNLAEGDVLFVALGEKTNAQKLLGMLRIEFTNLLESEGLKIRESDYELLWIIDFPLFTYNQIEQKLQTTHHPFTHPHPDDIQFLTTEPLKVRGLHYDLVLNGTEIGGGSIRIHDANMQRCIFNTLNINNSELMHMLDALACGAPPHGGIALGLDRLMCVLCNTSSIRSVMAFPKTAEGRDLMSNAPTKISDELKKLYHIQTTDE